MLAEQGKVEHFDFVSGASFFLKRMARLCPLYYLALLMVALLQVFALRDHFSHHGWSIQFSEAYPIQAILGQGLWPVSCDQDAYAIASMGANSPGWFVSDIIMLSACFPALYNLCPHSLGSCLYALAATLFAQFLFVGVFLEHFRVAPPLTYFWVGCRVPEFVAGMLSARICNIMPACIPAWSGWGWIFDASVIVFCAFIVLIPMDVDDPLIWIDNVLPIIISLLLISAHAVPRAQGMPEFGLLGKCLSWSPLQTLSRYSFAVYILQLPMLRVLKKLEPFIPMGSSASSFWPVWSFWDNWVLPVIFCQVAGVAAFHLIEEPARLLADAYVRERLKAGAAAP
jgi:peptidoglycan/LPS O-acetylase OafA/YrhL